MTNMLFSLLLQHKKGVFIAFLSAICMLLFTGSAYAQATATSISSAPVTIIGDSLSDGVNQQNNYYHTILPNSDVNAKVGRHFKEGMDILNSVVAAKTLKPILVFELGTNDSSVDPQDVERVIQQANGGKVIFVSIYNRMHPEWASAVNAVLQNAVAQHPGVVSIADWNKVASSHTKWFDTDSIGVHPNNPPDEGYTAFGNIVAQAVADAAGQGGTSISSDQSTSVNASFGTQNYETDSNIVTTRVGNPPITSGGDVLKWAQIINNAEEIGSGGGYSRMVADISNNGYTAIKHTGAIDGQVGPEGNYWCTYLVVDAYRLAGIDGLDQITHGAVINMVSFWQANSPRYKFFDYSASSPQVLSQINPGNAIFFEMVRGQMQPGGGGEHAAIVKTSQLDSRGNGSITTLDANTESAKGFTYPVLNWNMQNTFFPLVGFGATQESTSVPVNGTSKPVIVLDPGHSGTDISSIDPETGLQDHDYPNIPEISEVFSVAQQVKKRLETDGYTVLLTKNSANDSVSLRDRASIANNANAAIAVSIHDDHGQSWNNFAQIYVQDVGLYRETASGNKISFTNAAIAQKSQSYGQIFAQERTAAEHHSVAVTSISFNGRDSIAPGNIPLVELFATVPWVYNEVGTDGSGLLSQNKLDMYAQGIINGIEKSVPLTTK